MTNEQAMEGAGNMTGADVPLASRRAWLGLAVLALPCALYSMDLTVLQLALPRIAAELRPSSAQLLWIVDIYGFLVAGLLIPLGHLGDRIGRRRLLLIGGAAFGVASLAAACARGPGTLIAARALLGMAGATLAPSTLSLIRNMFPHPRQRGFAVGVWTASYATGGALGPVLGGVMLRYFPWWSVFLLAVPVMALLLLAGPRLLPESRDETARRLDLGSVALSLGAVLSVIHGLKVYVQDGSGPLPLLSVAVGLVLGTIFVRRQGRVREPLIDLRLLRSPAFGGALATYLLATLVTFGSYMVVGQYLQLVLGLPPLGAGVWMLPWSASYILGSFIAPLVARRIRPTVVMAAGLVVAAIGFALTTRVVGHGVGAVVIASTLYSLGMSPAFTLGVDRIIAAAPPRRAGAAAALSETSSELGGALGVAVLGSIATAIYRGDLIRAALPGVSGEARKTALDSVGGAIGAASRSPSAGPRCSRRHVSPSPTPCRRPSLSARRSPSPRPSSCSPALVALGGHPRSWMACPPTKMPHFLLLTAIDRPRPRQPLYGCADPHPGHRSVIIARIQQPGSLGNVGSERCAAPLSRRSDPLHRPVGRSAGAQPASGRRRRAGPGLRDGLGLPGGPLGAGRRVWRLVRLEQGADPGGRGNPGPAGRRGLHSSGARHRPRRARCLA
jgi:MFS transporter, DHA2 family, multidrug resistance protein